MKVNRKDFEKYGATADILCQLPEEDIEIIDILNDPHYSEEVIFFIKTFFDLSSEENATYNRLLCLNNSKITINSRRITNSSFIINSRDVIDSENIWYSDRVNKSELIYRGDLITSSDIVIDSERVSNSTKVKDSLDVKGSSCIFGSNNIEWSDNIIYSNSIKNSSFIYRGNDLDDCHFCGFLKNSDHCLFCAGLQDAMYQIFNKSVSPQEYENIREELFYRIQWEEGNLGLVSVDETKYLIIDKFKFGKTFTDVFRGLSEDFYDWVKTLPNYTNDVALSVFLHEI